MAQCNAICPTPLALLTNLQIESPDLHSSNGHQVPLISDEEGIKFSWMREVAGECGRRERKVHALPPPTRNGKSSSDKGDEQKQKLELRINRLGGDDGDDGDDKGERIYTRLPDSAYTPRPLPTRVLHVGSEDGEIPIQLHQTYGSLGTYAAFSHIWGPAETKMTTRIFQGRAFEVPLDWISAKMLDAIKICRKLNIDYLWVDNLCILQDSMVDREKEIRKLTETYRGSAVTIVAASSRREVASLNLRSWLYQEKLMESLLSRNLAFLEHLLPPRLLRLEP